MAAALEVTLAGPDDVDTVMAVMTEVAQWLITKGMDRQWPPVIPREFIAASVGKGEVYLARLNGGVAATVALQWSDQHIWGDRPDDACYVHRLAVRRQHAGQGLGLMLLRWAESVACQRGKGYLRLDCWAENPVLVRYYANAGFTQVGEVTVGTWKGALFERALQPK